MDTQQPKAILKRAYARIGLLGNPSDGYQGCTISAAIANFWAEVTLTPQDDQAITFIRHPVHDAESWGDLAAMSQHWSRYGSFSSGVDLLKVLCCVFHDHCQRHHIPIPTHKGGLSLSYDTNIPRQSGLAGSSAIITAGLWCLMEWYDVGAEHIPKHLQPNLVLAVEQALGITAGLQDRVAQVYGGLVHMDFQAVQQQGHGQYEYLDTTCLPPVYLIWGDSPSNSGKVHATVRQRWLQGDAEVQEGMTQLAGCARNGRAALEQGDVHKLAQLMTLNFGIRRRLFGDDVVGQENLRMVEVAKSVGASAKLPGSGGAIIAVCPEGEVQAAALKAACEQAGLQVVQVVVATRNWTE